MNKLLKLVLAAVIFSLLVTAGSYFIKQTRPLFLAALPPSPNCAVHSPPAGLQGTPAQTDRGFPAYYVQKLPQLHVHDNGCHYTVTYQTQFSWRHLLLDLAEWGLIGLLVIYLVGRFRSLYSLEVKKTAGTDTAKKRTGKGAKHA
jgi:hypothetical protein